MKNIYFIAFFLFFGVILLNIPQAYSVANANTSGDTITAAEALDEIKTKLCFLPKIRQLLVSGYIREDFTAHNKNCPNELTSLILCFLVKPYQDKESTKKILSWAVNNAKGYDFITDYLEEVRNSFTAYHYFDHLKVILGDHQLGIYAHKHNFLNKDLLLWLIKKLKWDVPKDAEIQAYQTSYNDRITDIIGYKWKSCRALSENDMDLYHMLCYLLLNGRSRDIHPSRLEKIRNGIFKKLSCRDRCLLFFSKTYWLYSDPTYIPRNNGRGIRTDICMNGVNNLILSALLLFFFITCCIPVYHFIYLLLTWACI